MKEKVEIYKSKRDNIHIKVTKDETGTRVIKVEHANGNSEVKQCSIKDLKLANEAERKRYFIDNIADDSTFETHASPGCFTYVYNGQAYTICI